MGDGATTKDWELESGDDELGFESEELSGRIDSVTVEELPSTLSREDGEGEELPLKDSVELGKADSEDAEIVIIKREALSGGEEVKAEEVKEEDESVSEEEVTAKENPVSEEGCVSGANFVPEGLSIEETVFEELNDRYAVPRVGDSVAEVCKALAEAEAEGEPLPEEVGVNVSEEVGVNVPVLVDPVSAGVRGARSDGLGETSSEVKDGEPVPEGVRVKELVFNEVKDPLPETVLEDVRAPKAVSEGVKVEESVPEEVSDALGEDASVPEEVRVEE